MYGKQLRIANQYAAYAVLARNLTARLRRAGLCTSIDVGQLGRLLREDADTLATPTDPKQQAVIEVGRRTTGRQA
jgi:hypothetical protein